jgi:hypothetical protein
MALIFKLKSDLRRKFDFYGRLSFGYFIFGEALICMEQIRMP